MTGPESPPLRADALKSRRRSARLVLEVGVIGIADRDGAVIARRLVAGMIAHEVMDRVAQLRAGRHGSPDVPLGTNTHTPAIDGLGIGNEDAETPARQRVAGC